MNTKKKHTANPQLMKKANGYFKPAYTDPHHYPDDVIAPVAVSRSRYTSSTRYIPDVDQYMRKEQQQRRRQKALQQQPQHVADAPSSSLLLPLSSQNQTKTPSSLLLPSPNSYIHTKLNDDYHIGNKINVMPQLRIKAKQKYFVDQNERDDDVDDGRSSGSGNEKRERETRKIEDNKLNYAVCLRVIYFSRVNQ